MEKKKLHRIVGILILIAVVIIILPLVTGRNDGPDSKTLSLEAPAFPDDGTDNVPAEAPPAEHAVPPASESTAAPVESSPAVTPPTASFEQNALPAVPEKKSVSSIPDTSSAEPVRKPVISTETLASKKSPIQSGAAGWAVQMGNFHNHTNAIRLANRLRASGFKAFTRQVVSRTGVVSTRVYVGPEMAEASAKKRFDEIHSAFHLEGIVIPFEPLSL